MRSSDDTATPATTPQQQGYFAKDATIITTNEQGVAQIKLTADTIEQNLKDDSIRLQTVKVDYLSAPDRPWLLTAASAYVPPDSRTIDFQGNVVVRPVGAQANNVVLRTETLHVDTNTSIASSRSDVSVEMNRHRLSAHGVTADLKREHYQLESKGHGQFAFQ
jgi:LPS export ABC transporter protein LptC